MTTATGRQSTSAAAKELRSLASSFLAIRILKQTADTPLDAVRLGERLRANDPAIGSASLRRALLRMRRCGWIKTKDSSHFITPSGRRVLHLAISGLKDLAALSDPKS